jgi:hypothetical protein
VFAQDATALATRRSLIEQAQAARGANNHQEALELSERASRIQMTPSLRLFIAQEQYSLGRLAEAFGNADACMREAEADTQARNREQVAQTCRSLSQELRGRIAHVVIHPPNPSPAGLQVTVNGNALTDALWGVPYVVTPGHVTVVAHANGYRDFQQEIDVAAAGNSDVQLNLEAMPQASASPDHGGEQHAAASGPPQDTGNHGPGILPLVVAGGGVVIAIVGGLLFIPQQSEINSTTMLCPSFHCPDPATAAMAQPHRDAAVNWSIAAYTTLGVGGAVAIAGVVWFIVSRPSSHPPSAAFHIVPTQDGAVVGIHGIF